MPNISEIKPKGAYFAIVMLNKILCPFYKQISGLHTLEQQIGFWGLGKNGLC